MQKYIYITNDTHTLTQKVPPRLNLAQDGVKRPILLQGKLAFAQMDLPGRCCRNAAGGSWYRWYRFIVGDIRESPEKSLKCRIFLKQFAVLYGYRISTITVQNGSTRQPLSKSNFQTLESQPCWYPCALTKQITFPSRKKTRKSHVKRHLHILF